MKDPYPPKPGDDGTDDWLSLLDQHQVEFAVLSARGDGHWIQLMQSHGAWGVRYQDRDTALLVRVLHGDDRSSASQLGNLRHP